jgi:transcriptional repressor NrdR
MKCPQCGSPENRVIDSRMSRDGRVIRRRRHCESCTYRFTTYERVEYNMPTVIKRDGRREMFDRAKLQLGVMRACVKRTVAAERIEQLVDEVERELADLPEREVETRSIGERVLSRLRDLDEVAYVRFASIYRSFADAEDFIRELKELRRKKRTTQPWGKLEASAQAPSEAALDHELE